MNSHSVYYLINDKVRFYPRIHMLQDEHGQTLQLAVPASLCFQLLIQRPGELVPHSTLLDEVWNNRGMFVTANTLYQNVSILRKTLEKVGLPSKIIKTIPKRGILLCDQVKIRYEEGIISSEGIEERTISSGDYEGDSFPTSATEANTAPESRQEHSIIAQESGVVSPSKLSNQKSELKTFNRNRYGRWIMVAGLVLGLFSLAIIKFYHFLLPTPESYSFKNYRLLADIGQCHIYRNVNQQLDGFFEPFVKLNLKHGCKNQWVYLTNNPPSSYVSVVKCRRNLQQIDDKTQPECGAYFYLTGVPSDNE